MLGCLISNSLFATVTATTDRTQVPRGESLQLTLRTDNLANSQGPDISLLNQNFDLLSQMRSTQISVMNGKKTVNQQWTFVLVPTHTGQITIPAITIGKEKTNPISITVTEANDIKAPAAQNNVFLTASLNPETPYVQSQALYTLKLYYANQVMNPELKEPDSPQVKVFHVGRDLTYPANIHGRNYQVMELHFLVVPQVSGNIHLQAAQFSGNIATQNTQGYYGPSWRPVVVSAPAVSLNAKAIPSRFANQWWLPAGKVTLSEQYQPALSTVRAGDPITRIITMTAIGTSAENLPSIGNDNLPGASIYLDKPNNSTQIVGDNLVATRIQRMVIIPSATGKLTIPAIHVSWFNTQTNSLSVASLPASTLMVIANPHMSQNSLPPPITSPIKQTIEKSANHDSMASISSKSYIRDLWFWLATSLFFLWIVTLIILWRTRKHKKIIPDHLHDLPRRQLLAKANGLAEANEAIAFAQVILSLSQNLWPAAQIHQLGDLKPYLDEAGKQVIDDLNAHLYHHSPKPWQGTHAWNMLKKQLLTKLVTQHTHTDLPPTYPKDHS